MKKKMYFTQEHEEAIIKYALTDDREIRTELYVEWIQPAFDEMVDKIVYTYKFTGLPNIDELRAECKVWLTTILDKYDPNKGSKAFSYFSVITKNWFIHKVKYTTKRLKREVEFNSVVAEIDEKYAEKGNKFIREQEEKEFWFHLWQEIESWNSDLMKPNEKRVYEAVKVILKSVDDIEIFNKKAVYLYLRELTDLNTKQIVSQLNKMRKKYRTFKRDWDEGKI
jgi:DNA-directed RNA polymerase specialized sigma subunit